MPDEIVFQLVRVGKVELYFNPLALAGVDLRDYYEPEAPEKRFVTVYLFQVPEPFCYVGQDADEFVEWFKAMTGQNKVKPATPNQILHLKGR